MKKIFLTGGSGFIGRNIIAGLDRKYQIFAPSHQELDLTDSAKVFNFLKKRRVDVVIHTANVGGNKDEAQFPDVVEYNLKIFFNLVRCSHYFNRMIHFGSGAEYGKQVAIVNIKEEDFGKIVPTDSYGFYKYVCAQYIETHEKIVSLRLFGAFGPYEKYKFRFISQAICRNLLHLPIIINRNVYFNYVYVKDVVRIIDLFLDDRTLGYKFYNIGGEKKIDLVSLAKIINKVSGKLVKIIVKDRSLNKEYTCNSTRFKNEFDNFHFTPFSESVAELYQWYNSTMLGKLKPEDLKP